MTEELHVNVPNLGKLHSQTIQLRTTGSVAVLGKSGSGKSTFLKLLAGLVGKQKQEMYELFGYSWSSESSDNPCVYVNQNFSLFATWNVEQNLTYTHEYANSQYNKDIPALSVKEVVTELSLTSLLKKPVLSLSGGETQRVLIARAMLSNKPIILLDEVFNSLDRNMKTYVMHKLIRWEKQFKRNFIVVSHQLSDAAFLCQQALLVKEGVITGYPNFLSALVDYEMDPEFFVSTLDVEYFKTIKSEAVHVYKLKNSDQIIYRKAHPEELIAEHAFVRLQVAASQVSLCTELDINISTLNKLKGTVSKIDSLDSGVTICINVDGQTLQAHISLRSQQQMKLNEGQAVTALFKAV